jgi:hypothetical protein
MLNFRAHAISAGQSFCRSSSSSYLSLLRIGKSTCKLNGQGTPQPLSSVAPMVTVSSSWSNQITEGFISEVKVPAGFQLSDSCLMHARRSCTEGFLFWRTPYLPLLDRLYLLLMSCKRITTAFSQSQMSKLKPGDLGHKTSLVLPSFTQKGCQFPDFCDTEGKSTHWDTFVQTNYQMSGSFFARATKCRNCPFRVSMASWCGFGFVWIEQN